MTSPDPDAELMARVRAGDTAAFRELIERHQRMVIRTIHRAIGDAWEAEDLAQRVFVQVYRAAGRYRPTAKFTTWLFTIVHRTILNERRRRSRHASESLEALREPRSADGTGLTREFADPRAVDPAREVADRELQDRIQAAIQELPEQQRLAVILARFEGLPYEEIATVLGCSVPAVKSLLHRARVTLRERLKGELGA
ncbi:sigma-70 family RNA polymerase sigma factor [bacterium]|nr:sigma-70 family RNA polymerase sigma factor [bacterium]